MIGFILLVTLIGVGLGWGQQHSLQIETFFNPDNVDKLASNFMANPVWRIGEVQTIRWTTTSSEYTISLWQQSIKSGSASPGPPIFQSRSASDPTQFDWVPQIFDFDLSESNVFFLRLRPGIEAANPGGASDAPSSMRSRYFNLSIPSSPPPRPPPLLLQRAISATEIGESAPTIPPSFTALTLDSGPPPPSRGPSQSAAPQPTYIIAGTSSTSTPDPLSTGAKIGIGVGAAVGGLALVLVGVLLTSRRVKKRDSAVRMSTWKDLPTTPPPRIPTAVAGGPYSPYSSHFYQLKGEYPPSTIKSHRQVTISETSLGYHPTKAAELG
ncbi:hypothetical protein PGQ11_000076 [Apiospora arundinis]